MSSAVIEQLKTLGDPAPPRFARLETPLGLMVLRWVIGIVLALGLLGCVTKGANGPPDPYLAPPGSDIRTPLAGFGEAQVKVQTADKLLTWCLLLAANDQQRARGLMQVTDRTLGGYDGMLFRYDHDVDEQYWMRNTPMPLSIAWISSTGQLVATADMAPCEDRRDCPNYPESGNPPPYRLAIEVPQGRLAALGIVEGSTITDTQQRCP